MKKRIKKPYLRIRMALWSIYFVLTSGIAIAQKIPDSLPPFAWKWIFHELEQAPVKDPMDLNSDSLFHAQPGRLVGYLRNYIHTAEARTGLAYTNNELTREPQPTLVQVHPDGRFEAEIPLLYPYQTYFNLAGKNIPFYLEPGQTLGLFIDWEDLLGPDADNRKIMYFGPLAETNHQLNLYVPEHSYFLDFNTYARTQTPESVHARLTEIYKSNGEALEQLIQEQQLGEKSAKILRLDQQLAYSYSILDYLETRNYLLQTDTTGNTYLRSSLPEDFYEFLQAVPLNRPYLLTSKESRSFLNRLEFSYPFRGSHVGALNYMYDRELYEKLFHHYLEEEGVELEESEKLFTAWVDRLNQDPFLLLSSSSEEDLFQKNKEYFRFYKKYESYYAGWSKKYDRVENHSLPRIKKGWELTDYLLAEHFNYEAPLSFEILRLRTINLSGKPDFEEQTAEDSQALLEALLKELSHPVLKNEACRLYREYAPKKDLKVIDIPEGKGKAVLDQIFRNHREKFLFVSFWATWCAPCLATMEQNLTVRNEYRNHPDFEFIFITDETSPAETYQKIVGEQELSHSYRLSVNEFNHVKEALKFHGLPKYIVVNKAGELINDNFRMWHFKSNAERISEEFRLDNSE